MLLIGVLLVVPACRPQLTRNGQMGSRGYARYCMPGSVSSWRKSPMSIARRFSFL